MSLTKTELRHWSLIKKHLLAGNTEPAKSWIREAGSKKALNRRSLVITDWVRSNNLSEGLGC